MAAPVKGDSFPATDPLAQKDKMRGSGVLDLSQRGLLRLEPDLLSPGESCTLILDENQIIKLEHLQLLHNLQTLSVVGNRLVRMSGVAGLQGLQVLDLRNNSIGIIEGLKGLDRLQWLSLAGNNIKTLLLHGNLISSLRSAPAQLPPSLSVLSLAENEIRDLSEVSFLSSLPALSHLSLAGNPCVSAATSLCCDHRPFVLSVCTSLKQLDGRAITHSEVLTGDRLHAQSAGGVFGPGRHTPLLQHLASVCPLMPVADTHNVQHLSSLQQPQIRPTHLNVQPPLQKSKEDDIVSPAGVASDSTDEEFEDSLASRHPLSQRLTKDIQNFSSEGQKIQLMEKSPLETEREQKPKDVLHDSAERVNTEATESERSVAAVRIQSWWRGTRTRLLNPDAKETRAEIRLRRLQQHITHLNKHIHRLHKQQEEERRQRRVQEEAIRFLWKQVCEKRLSKSPRFSIMTFSSSAFRSSWCCSGRTELRSVSVPNHTTDLTQQSQKTPAEQSSAAIHHLITIVHPPPSRVAHLTTLASLPLTPVPPLPLIPVSLTQKFERERKSKKTSEQKKGKSEVKMILDGLSAMLSPCLHTDSPNSPFPTPLDCFYGSQSPGSDSEQQDGNEYVQRHGRYQGVRVRNTVKELIKRKRHLHDQVHQDQTEDGPTDLLQMIKEKREAEGCSVAQIKLLQFTGGKQTLSYSCVPQPSLFTEHKYHAFEIFDDINNLLLEESVTPREFPELSRMCLELNQSCPNLTDDFLKPNQVYLEQPTELSEFPKPKRKCLEHVEEFAEPIREFLKTASSSPAEDPYSLQQEPLNPPQCVEIQMNSEPSSITSSTAPVSFFYWQIQQEQQKLAALSPLELIQKDEDGDTFLHIAVAQGRRALAYVLARKMVTIGMLDEKEHNQQSALQICVAADHHLIAQDLLSIGAEISTADSWGRTPLHVCAEKGHTQTLQVIEKYSQCSGRPIDTEPFDFQGLTPLHVAVMSHNSVLLELRGHVTANQIMLLKQKRKQLTECVNILLRLGASLMTQDLKSGRTALHMAAEDSNLELLKIFLDQPNYYTIINAKTFSGNTALHLACARSLRCSPDQSQTHVDSVKLLLRRGADPALRNLENEQPCQLVQPGPNGDQVMLTILSNTTGVLCASDPEGEIKLLSLVKADGRLDHHRLAVS
ncbi:hypothetical protein DNTS_024813 [Danionella cerebrum]|uniref:OCA domain-containing protein n=1 Tax=Danionella cerebrum TaxID=2873325 RepID=A0A553QRY6_9TELE|nr:hypothetical protein DNTS_024813 [Danionella translucida]